MIKKYKKNIVILGFYLCLVAVLYYLDVQSLISFDTIKTYREQLLAFVNQYGWLAPLLYMLIYATLISLSIPSGTVMTITGGFLFGAVKGTIYTVIAATLGATVIFLLAQTAIGKPLRERAGPALQRLSKGFQENAFSYLLTLRLLPLFPFFTINLVPAVLGIPLRTYIFATAIGIIPGTYVYTVVGSGIGEIFDRGEVLNLGSIMNPQIITAFIGLAILSLLPVIYNKWKKNNKVPNHQNDHHNTGN